MKYTLSHRKYTKLIALSLFFAISSLNVYAAKIACPAGQERNSQGKCVKKSRVTKDKAKKKTRESSPMMATNRANNAINAYNKALTSTKPDATKIQATQQAAIKAINNLTSVYSQYLEIITSGKNAVSYVSQTFENNPTISTNSSLTSNNKNMDLSYDSRYVSSCYDGSTAMCDDGTAINTLTCDDGSAPDVNGMCTDGSLVICPRSGNNPMCFDGTTAW